MKCRSHGKKHMDSVMDCTRCSEMAQEAVLLQSHDGMLWDLPKGRDRTLQEAYLQESLRDFHRVVEDGDELAFERIRARTMDWEESEKSEMRHNE